MALASSLLAARVHCYRKCPDAFPDQEWFCAQGGG